MFLEILDGPKQGQKFEVTEGLLLGRKEGQVLLDYDAKASGRHAQIEADAKGLFFLVDLDSSNGIVFNNSRLRRLALLPDLTFRVGNTHFKVSSATTLVVKNIQTIKTWRDHLAEFLQQTPGTDEAKEVHSFSPSLQLEFSKGMQADQVLSLFYGPRRAGFMHYDIDLLDPAAPDELFELSMKLGRPTLSRLSQFKIYLNKSLVETDAPLEDGDQIEFGQTTLVVRYL